MIKKGDVGFIKIGIKENSSSEIIFDHIEVINNETTAKIAYLRLKKGYKEIYDCYDGQDCQLKDIFICQKCHDVFKLSGGNAARHALQHNRKNQVEKETLFRRKIRLFIYKTAQPFSIVEDESFRDLFAMNLCSVESFQKSMEIDYLYFMEEIKTQLHKANSICLIMDEWSYQKNSYIGITAFLTGKVFCDSIVLALSIPGNYDRTALTISQELSQKISLFDIKHLITGAIIDCAAVMKKAINIFDIPWAPCLAHIIHNSIRKMLDGCVEFDIPMKHANVIADDFRFKQYLGAHSKIKKNVQTFSDSRWLTRAKTCKDIVKLFPMMKHHQTDMNNIISARNSEKSQKINNYSCPITKKI